MAAGGSAGCRAGPRGGGAGIAGLLRALAAQPAVAVGSARARLASCQSWGCAGWDKVWSGPDGRGGGRRFGVARVVERRLGDVVGEQLVQRVHGGLPVALVAGEDAVVGRKLRERLRAHPGG
ncbi:hypothetical protein, partial [Halorubrum lacusprofundi]|uniref:hypothetical protein n=1 Tax=Halorubrum lacusprofundi TaxID=2247 RepID=UPI00197A89DD